MNWISAPGSEGRGAARRHVTGIRTAFVAVAALGVAIHAANALADGDTPLITDWLYCGLYLLAAAACARRARSDDAGRAWGVAAVGVLVWGCSEIAFRMLAPNPRTWYPDASQALLFVAFALAYTTLAMLARERVSRLDVVLGLDGLVAGLAAVAVAALLLFPATGRVTRGLRRLSCSWSALSPAWRS